MGIILLAVLLTGCGDRQAEGDPAAGSAVLAALAAPVLTTSATETAPDLGLPPHPGFTTHFTADIYSDSTAQFGPFGSDVGSGLLREWSRRAAELTPSSTVRDLLADDADDPATIDTVLFDVLHGRSADPDQEQQGAVEAASTVLGAGFTLLWLTGHIDAEGEQVTLEAVDTLEDAYGRQPELDRLRQDLLTFTGPTSP